MDAALCLPVKQPFTNLQLMLRLIIFIAPDLQVGSVNNTFGIQGVGEHCQFFKTIEDATRLRKRISECFERAALPNVSCMCCCQLTVLQIVDAAAAVCHNTDGCALVIRKHKAFARAWFVHDRRVQAHYSTALCCCAADVC
jgi:hypothetical protein